jgi:hypothetical protein
MAKATELARPVSQQLSIARERRCMVVEEVMALRDDLEQCERRLQALSDDQFRLAELRWGTTARVWSQSSFEPVVS